MRIRLIEVENFMSHSYEKITLPAEGIVLLSGPSGAGKSSLIVDAPAFALFGVKASKRVSRMDDLMTWGKDTFFVRVAFEMPDGKRFEIKRGIKANGATEHKSIDSTMTDPVKGANNVRDHIKEFFGEITPEAYYNTCTTPQGEIDLLQRMGGTDRERFVLRLLGADRLDDAVKKVRKWNTHESGRITQLENQLGGILYADLQTRLGELDAQLNEHQTRLNESEAQAKGAEKRADVAAQQRAAVALVAAELQQIAQELGEIRIDIERTLAQQEKLEQAAKTYADDVQLASELEAIIAQGKELRNQLDVEQAKDRTWQQAATSQKTLQSLLERKARLQAELDVLQADADGPTSSAIKEEMASLTSEGKQLVERRKEIIENKDKLSDEHVCYTCLRPISDSEHEHLTDNIEQTIEQIDARVVEMRERHKELTQLLAAAEARELQQLQRDKLAVQLEEIDKQVQTEQEKIPADIQPADHELIANLEEQRSQALARAQSAQAAAQKIADMGDPTTKLAEVRETLINLKERESDKVARQKELTADGSDPQKISAELEDTERALRRQAGELVSAGIESRQQISNLTVEQTRINETLDSFKNWTDELADARALSKKYADLETLTKQFKKHLATETRPQLESVCSQFMATLSQEKHVGLRITPEYDLVLLNRDGTETPFKSASGGEKTRASLALRMALTRLVTERTGSPIRYLVLDEIFEAQDEGHRDQMIAVLRILQNAFPQIFLISHVGDLADAGRVDYVLKVSDEEAKERIGIPEKV